MHAAGVCHAPGDAQAKALAQPRSEFFTILHAGAAYAEGMRKHLLPPKPVPGELTVLFSREQILERVTEIGAEISRRYKGESLVLIGVLKGAAFFLADLARAISLDCTFDFVAVTSYGKSTKTSGAVKLIKDLDHPIEGKTVVVVEDILDTGVTLSYLCKLLRQHHPRALLIAACLDKPGRRLETIEADYVCFTIENHFVVGYGMDFAEQYRNLPDICLMPPDQAD